MSKLVHQMLATLQTEWPKALLGAAIPMVQYGWKFRQESQVESQKKKLRETIRELAQFREVALPDDPQSARIKSDAEREYAEAVARLARICELQRMAAERSGEDKQSAVAAPAPVAIGAPNEPPPAATAVVATPEEDRQSIAAKQVIHILEKQAGTMRARPWFQRWFLLYVPTRPVAWIPQTLYFIAFCFTAIAAGEILSDPRDPEFWFGLLGVGVFAGVTLLLRKWAISANTDPAVKASAKSSRKPRRWIAKLVTWILAVYEGCLLLDMAVDKDTGGFRENYGVVIITSSIVAAIIFVMWYRVRSRT